MNLNDAKKIYIYGGGGHGKVVIDAIRARYGADAVRGIFDDDPAKKNTEFYGHRIIGSIKEQESRIENLIMAIGDNQIRANKFAEISGMVNHCITVVHPTAYISPSAKIGAGTVIMAGVIINADARIGDHCIINTNAIIEHDCSVGNFSHVAPGTVLAGGVQIGRLTLLGANSTVVPYKHIGHNCLIGAGSVVTRDVPDFSILRGNPGRVIKTVRFH